MKDVAYRIPKRDKGSAYLRLKINFDTYTVMMGKYLTETEYLKAVDVYVKCLGCDTKARLEAVAMVKAGDRVGARLFSQKLFKEYYNG